MSRIQLRRDTSTRWGLFNPVLGAGEIGIDLTLGAFKLGNGSDTWTELEWGTVFWSQIGIPGGVVPLDDDGHIPPEFIEFPDIPEDTHYFGYNSLAHFPNPGVGARMYMALDTMYLYRWNGSAYIQVAKPADATNAEVGLIKLAGDLGGTALLPKVTKLNGIAMPTNTPEPGQVIKALTSSTSSWQNDIVGGGGGGGGGDDERFAQFEQNIGDGTDNPITVTHMMGTRQIVASMTRRRGDCEIVNIFRMKAPSINAVIIEPDMILEDDSWRLTLIGSLGLSDIEPPEAPEIEFVSSRSDKIVMTASSDDPDEGGFNWFIKLTDDPGSFNYAGTSLGAGFEFLELVGATEYDIIATALDSSGNESEPSEVFTHTTPAGARATITPTTSTIDTTFFGPSWGNGIYLHAGGAMACYGRGSADYGFSRYFSGIMCRQAAQTEDWYTESKISGAGGDDRGNFLVVGGNSATAFSTGVLLVVRQGDCYFTKPNPGFATAPPGGSGDGTIRSQVAVTLANNDVWRARVTKEGSDYRYRGYQNGILRSDFLDVGGVVYGVPGKIGGWGQIMLCTAWQQFFSPYFNVGPLVVSDIVMEP